MEPLNATAIERDKRQPKAQQMLGLADDEYVNLTDRPEPANEVRPGKPWRMLQLGERGTFIGSSTLANQEDGQSRFRDEN